MALGVEASVVVDMVEAVKEAAGQVEVDLVGAETAEAAKEVEVLAGVVPVGVGKAAAETVRAVKDMETLVEEAVAVVVMAREALVEAGSEVVALAVEVMVEEVLAEVVMEVVARVAVARAAAEMALVEVAMVMEVEGKAVAVATVVMEGAAQVVAESAAVAMVASLAGDAQRAESPWACKENPHWTMASTHPARQGPTRLVAWPSTNDTYQLVRKRWANCSEDRSCRVCQQHGTETSE